MNPAARLSVRLITAAVSRSAPGSTRLIATTATFTPFHVQLQASRSLGTPQRRWKSKKSSAQYIDESAAEDDDVPVIKTKGKGGGKGKGAAKEGDYKTSTRNQDLPDEKFNMDTISANMKRAVERCRTTTSHLVGSFGRADPSLLNSIKVEPKDGGKHSLQEVATIGVRDGMLIVTAFDPDYVKAIQQAIYSANLGLSPQASTNADEANVVRVAVPKPTAETRQNMFKEITKICENARVSIRTARHLAMKQIKADIEQRIVSKTEGDKEGKKVDVETKKFSAEVDQLLAKLKTTLLSPK